MSVVLKDTSNQAVYTFPSGCELIEDTFQKRLKTEEKVYSHGSEIISDEKVDAKTVVVHGIFKKDSQSAMESELSDMRKYCYTKNLRLYATQYSDYFYKVECLNFDSSYLGMFTVAEVEVEFLVVDPFRYYKDETSDDETVSSSPHSYTVANGGSVEVSPVVTFTCGAGASITKIKIENSTDSNKYFEYEPASALTENDVVKVDCRDATCNLNGGSDISHFSGVFFELLSGDNSIVVTITGTVGTNICNFSFRKKYL